MLHPLACSALCLGFMINVHPSIGPVTGFNNMHVCCLRIFNISVCLLTKEGFGTVIFSISVLITGITMTIRQAKFQEMFCYLMLVLHHPFCTNRHSFQMQGSTSVLGRM
jgi:hypothetical protein